MNTVENKWHLPTKVGDVDVAFPASVKHLMPSMEEIPKEFQRGRTYWSTLTSEWFFRGLKSLPTSKEGVDRNQALRHLKCIMGSFEPRHEHKEAAVAYLMSLWFIESNKS